MKKLILFILPVLTFCQNVSAQITGELNVLDRDLFYLQYLTPNTIQDNVNYQEWSVKFSPPPIRNNKLSIYSTLGVDLHTFNYTNDFAPILINHTQEVKSIYQLNCSFFSNYSLSKKWSLNSLSAVYVTSSTSDKFSYKDITYNGNLFAERTFIRKKGGYLQIGAGLGLITFNGKVQLSPVTHVKGRINAKWSFVAGFPNAYLKWDINDHHSVKALLDLTDFSSSLNQVTIESQQVSSIVFTNLAVGLEYNYWLNSSFGVMFRATKSFWNNYELRSDNSKSPLELNDSFQYPFIQVGIKYNPIRKLQNSLNPL